MDQELSTQPIACDFTAMGGEMFERYQELRGTIETAAQGIDELPDGYAIRFPNDLALFLTLAEFISLERLCCPFLTFILELGADSTVRLRFTSEDEVKQFLRAELGLA